MTDPIVAITPTVARISARTCWIFVELRARSGLTGTGEASLQGREREVVAALRRRGAGLIGADAAPRPPRTGDVTTLAESAAASALDHALHDIAARRRGEPLATRLGGARRDRIGLYANINRRTRDRTPEGFAASARLAMAAGFRAFKLAPFDEVVPTPPDGLSRSAATDLGLARIAAVRAAIGHGLDLMVDCHWRFSETEAADLARELAALDVVWFECPIPESIDAIPSIRRLRRRANRYGMRLAGCEELVGLGGFAPYIAAEAYDALMPDVKYVGGLDTVMRLAEVMYAKGVAFSPHNPSGPICHAISLHVSAAAGALDRLEVQFDESPLFRDLADGVAPTVSDGACDAPALPGIGLRLAAETLRTCRIDVDELATP